MEPTRIVSVASVEVRYYGPDIDIDIIRVRTRSKLICRLIAERLLELIKHYCPVLWGFPQCRWYPPPFKLRESFVIKEYARGKGYYITIDDAKMASIVQYVHNGTKPHPIFPRHRNVLRFWKRDEQEWKFRRAVNHPGAKAQPFIEKALNTLESELTSILLWGVRGIGRPG